MKISDDSYAILLLCSDIATRNTDGDIKPYTTLQWSNLADRLVESRLTPSALFRVSSAEIGNLLNLSHAEIQRIERLLSRAAKLGIELSNLNNKGIFALTRFDKEYPLALKNKLRKLAPPVLYYTGNLSLFGNKGVSIVGSREIDEAASKFTEQLSKRCTDDGLNIVSGGARGVDSIAENVANRSDGTTVIVVADSLEKKIRRKETRDAIMRKQSLILSAFRPDMPFQTYVAMERNKYVYALSDFVVIISSDYNRGGTWAGATENIRNRWVPMFVRKAEQIPQGNVNLLKTENVHAITEQVINNRNVNMYEWFTSHSRDSDNIVSIRQLSLFDLAKSSG